MRQIRRIILFALLLILQSALMANDLPSSAEIQSLMLKNWKRIEDYQVDIRLSLKIPGFRMPSRKIHYLYKAPDKSKIQVKGFAIVPKQGIQPFFTFLKDSVDFNVVADSILDGNLVYAVAIEDTFMNKAGQIRFFVDQTTGSIYEARVKRDGREFFTLRSAYTSVDGIPFPVSTDIRMKFPPDFRKLQRLGKKPSEMKAFDAGMTDEWLEGRITIKFRNYQVNQGIPDYIFEDETEDEIQE